MDAVKFIKERNRMCDFYSDCHNCPAYDMDCDRIRFLNNDIVNVVENWSKSHPQKTIMQDFLEKYPNAPKHNGIPKVCSAALGYNGFCDIWYEKETCETCWNQPMED